MTLEGEYYQQAHYVTLLPYGSRNPHDIGRRILPKLFNPIWIDEECRNPHDIGRRILRAQKLGNEV